MYSNKGGRKGKGRGGGKGRGRGGGKGNVRGGGGGKGKGRGGGKGGRFRTPAWESWQTGPDQLRLPNTHPTSQHTVSFACWRCGAEIVAADDIFKLKDGCVWTNRLPPTLQRGEQFENPSKGVGHQAHCKHCSYGIGAIYDQPWPGCDPDRELPCAKLTHIRERKRDGVLLNSVVLRGNSRAEVELALSQQELSDVGQGIGVRTTQASWELTQQLKKCSNAQLQERAQARQREDEMEERQAELTAKLEQLELAGGGAAAPTPAPTATLAEVRTCVCCLDDEVALEDGIECDGDTRGDVHFCCNTCFDCHVSTKAGEEQRLLEARGAAVCCPSAPACDAAHFSDALVCRHVTETTFALHLEAKARLVEARLARRMEAEYAQRLAAEAARIVAAQSNGDARVAELRHHVVENILTLHCPRCNAAFLNFTGCFALTCGNCGAGFCAYCLKDCRDEDNDAHRHVGRCEHNIAPGRDVFANVDLFEKAQRRRRTRMLQVYLRGIAEPQQQADLLRACAADLRDLGMDVGHFAVRDAPGGEGGGGAGAGGDADAGADAELAAAIAAVADAEDAEVQWQVEQMEQMERAQAAAD